MFVSIHSARLAHRDAGGVGSTIAPQGGKRARHAVQLPVATFRLSRDAQDAIDFGIKLLTVIEILKVSQLVADDIVHQWFIEQQQPEVEIHIAQRGTGAPPRTHIFERHALETHAPAFCPSLHARRKHQLTLATQALDHALIEPLLPRAAIIVLPHRQAQVQCAGRTPQLGVRQTGHFLNAQLQQGGGNRKVGGDFETHSSVKKEEQS